MILGQAQQFASSKEVLTHISEVPWSNYTKSDYTLEQWHAACLIHIHDGEPTSKSECKLPVKTPAGALNRNGVHAAAAALAGARGGLKGVSADQKVRAARALKGYYSQLDEDLPESLSQSVDFGDHRVKPGSPGDVIEHYGVKGMRWGVRKQEELSKGVLSTDLSKGLADGNPAFQLSNTDDLTVDLSKGWADIRPKGGFANKDVAARHADLVNALEDFRNRFPAVRDMAIEVIPMSHVPGLESLQANKVPAALMSVKPGSARLFYNDKMEALEGKERKFVESMQPGVFDRPGFLGYHEMGHMLAAANGQQPPAWNLWVARHKVETEPSPGAVFSLVRQGVKHQKTQAKLHKDIFEKFGFKFSELSKLSPYGATQPAEALAELSGYYFSPQPKGAPTKLTPDQRERARAMFDYMGGVN